MMSDCENFRPDEFHRDYRWLAAIRVVGCLFSEADDMPCRLSAADLVELMTCQAVTINVTAVM